MKLQLILNEPGSGEVTVPTVDPAAADLASGKIVRVAYRGQYRGAFFVEDVREKRVTRGDYSGQEITVRGRGAMAVLDDAIVWYATQGETTRTFSGVHAVEPLITFINEAQARGSLQQLELDFTTAEDTDGNAWTDSRSLEYRVGMSLLDVMRQISGLGIDFSMTFDWTRNVYYLQAFKNGKGSDKSDTIIFWEGNNCIEVGFSETSTELGNVVLAEYASGQYVDVADSGSISTYRRRERFLSAAQAGSAAEATDYAQAELDDRKAPKTSISIRVTDNAGPMAFVDYGLGDWVGYAAHDAQTPTKYRIRGMTLEWNDQQKYATVTLHLNSIAKELEIRTAQTTGKLGGSLYSERAMPNDSLRMLNVHNNDPNAHPLRDEFIELKDTPADYTGQGGKLVSVNVAEDGLEFRALSEADISDLVHDAVKIQGRPVNAPAVGDDGKAITYDEANDKFVLSVASGGGATTFEGLDDVPAYAGNAGLFPRVKATEDGVEYADVATQAELDAHTGDTGNPHGVTKAQVGLGNVENLQNNLSATADPTANDDANAGYVVGSRWVNVGTDEEFVCLDASAGAAVWQSTTAQGTGGGDPDAIHDNVAGEISAITEKTIPASADLLLIEDSADSYTKKRVQVGNLPASGGSGGMNLIGSYDGDGTQNSVTITMPSGAASNYDAILVVANCRIENSGSVGGLRMRFSTGGSIDTGTNYRRRAEETGQYGSATEDTDVGDSFWLGRYTCAGGLADGGRFGIHRVTITGALNSTSHANIEGTSWVFPKAGEWRKDVFWGTWKNVAVIDAINFFTADGTNFSSGTTIRVYGLVFS